MLSPSADFLAAIGRGELNIAELYSFALTNNVTHYFTPHDESIVWGTPGVLYHSLPMERGIIDYKVNLQADQVEISLGNITTEFTDVLQANVLDGAIVTITRILYNEEYASGMQIVLFMGTTDVAFNRRTLVLTCTSILDSLNIVVPKNIYQEPCNNRLYDSTCTVVKADYVLAGTVSANATDYYTLTDVANLGAAAADYYALGEVHVTSGENIGVRRLVRAQPGTTITVASAFPHKMQLNDTYNAYPGCDKRPATCRDKFAGNETNFGGYVYIPKPEEIMF